jgi:hypothetical protein
MNKIERIIVTLAVAISGSAFSTSAQIYVRIRPVHVVVTRSVAPSPRHIWIEEDWNGRGDGYEYSGGHWAEPPREGYSYRRGYWSHGSRGHYWHAGSWQPVRQNRQYNGRGGHNNGHQKGHNNGHGNGRKGGHGKGNSGKHDGR